MRLIWTKRAVKLWIDSKPDPAHTISAPNIGEVYKGYVAQFTKGTIWILVDGDRIIDSGTAGVGSESELFV